MIPDMPKGYRIKVTDGPWGLAKVTLHRAVWYGWKRVDYYICNPSEVVGTIDLLFSEDKKRRHEAAMLAQNRGVYE